MSGHRLSTQGHVSPRNAWPWTPGGSRHYEPSQGGIYLQGDRKGKLVSSSRIDSGISYEGGHSTRSTLTSQPRQHSPCGQPSSTEIKTERSNTGLLRLRGKYIMLWKLRFYKKKTYLNENRVKHSEYNETYIPCVTRLWYELIEKLSIYVTRHLLFADAILSRLM